MKYRVLWDNGVSACECFSQLFDTYEEADAFGREWAYESNVRDFGDPEGPPGGDGYSYEVLEAKDEDADNCDGHAHIRARQVIK